jgi:hypothetical protein
VSRATRREVLVAPPSRRLSRGHLALGVGARHRRYRFKGEDKLQFEVNGQDYFLNFAEDEAYWYVLAPTLTGVQRIPVYVDSPAYERFGILGKNRHNIQN